MASAKQSLSLCRRLDDLKQCRHDCALYWYVLLNISGKTVNLRNNVVTMSNTSEWYAGSNFTQVGHR